MSQAISRQVIMKTRPRGMPEAANFAIIDAPVAAPKDGELLVRTVYLSLDPYMRGRMAEARSYTAPLQEGDVITGGTIGQVVESQAQGFNAGDFVLTHSGWQSMDCIAAKTARKLDPALAPISTALGILGMPGFTAYVGLLDHGRPEAGETVVVSAASGAVGAAVGQIAKLKGCRVVGVAGSAEKCAYVVEELGFDACVSHRTDSLAADLAAECPKGIDVYFENVAGRVLEAVIPLFNPFSRMPVCGLISQYNATELPPGPDKLPLLLRQILTNKMSVRGFIISDHANRFSAFQQDMAGWIRAGEVKYREDIVEGLENAVEAFRGLLQGRNFGKLLVRVSDDPTR